MSKTSEALMAPCSRRTAGIQSTAD